MPGKVKAKAKEKRAETPFDRNLPMSQSSLEVCNLVPKAVSLCVGITIFRKVAMELSQVENAGGAYTSALDRIAKKGRFIQRPLAIVGTEKTFLLLQTSFISVNYLTMASFPSRMGKGLHQS